MNELNKIKIDIPWLSGQFDTTYTDGHDMSSKFTR